MITIDQPPTTLGSFDHLQPRAGVLKAWVGGGDGISRGVGHAGRPGGDRVHRVYEKMTECFAHTTGLPSFSAPCSWLPHSTSPAGDSATTLPVTPPSAVAQPQPAVSPSTAAPHTCTCKCCLRTNTATKLDPARLSNRVFVITCTFRALCHRGARWRPREGELYILDWHALIGPCKYLPGIIPSPVLNNCVLSSPQSDNGGG